MLKDDLQTYYDADLYQNCYKKKDLLAYVQKTKHQCMGDLASWRRYTCGYIKIIGWLKSKGKITDQEKATYCWVGIGQGL